MSFRRRLNFALTHPLLAAKKLAPNTRADLAAQIERASSRRRLRNGGNPTELDDLAEYLGLPQADIALQMTRSTASMANRWRLENPRVPRDVKEFYRHCSEYLFSLARWNMMNENYLALLEELKDESDGKCLSFGGGIGTESLTLAAQGNEVFYCDVPDSPVWKFSEWRAKRANMPIQFVADVPERVGFDCVVAFAVFQSLSAKDVETIITKIARSLKQGGRLYCRNHFGPTDVFPMHYDHHDLWESLVAGLPLRKEEREGLYRKVSTLGEIDGVRGGSTKLPDTAA